MFPGRSEYHDPNFAEGMLAMLGVKTTCKDRWRQVLSEAQRIPNKHLLTLESAISENQTAEMTAWHLTLVVPKPLQESYTDAQRKWLWGVNEFAKFIAAKQAG
ncbi:type II restriction endonuclease [Rhodanobacter sp. UC4436_H3]